MRSVTLVGCVFALGVLLAFGLALRGQVDNVPNKGWVDYEDLNQVERLKERPGNFRVLGAVSEFFEGSYSVRPDYSQCAYPLYLDAQTHSSWDSLQKELDEMTANGKKPKNHLRAYNVQVRSLSIHDAETFPDTAEFKRFRNFTQKRFREVRKAHPGRAVVALVTADLESLRGPKVEKGDSPILLYLVHSKDRWQVACFQRP